MSTPTTGNGVSQVSRHPEFYIRDGNVAFLAEKILFRVHRFFFERESEFFQTRFLESEANDAAPRDDIDNHPYILDDVKSDDFAKLLWVWYNPRYTYSRQPKETWLVVVQLANRWGFGEMRNLAIRQLEKIKIEPVEKITLYRENKIDHSLLIPSYVALCQSPTLPTSAEGERLEMDTVLKIATARERAQRSAAESGCRSPTSASADVGALESIISELFELGIKNDDSAKTVNGSSNGANTIANASKGNSNRSGADAPAPTITVNPPKKDKAKQETRSEPKKATK
ncbi:hypothetical protein F5I97DRAFT_1903722 [Phlebopus sp. FC_14]|nr:hypothetical protein F5I97DRAFT_1903722 [Phlebopus sp. FC_14]